MIMAQNVPRIAEEKDESCRFYLARKKRHCRLQKMKGKDFCVQHVPAAPNTVFGAKSEDENYRMQCPLDPRHTCDRRKLEKHLKACNKTKLIPQDPWYAKGINSNKIREYEGLVTMLRDAPSEEIKNLISRISKISLDPPLKNEDAITHPALSSELLEFRDCETAMKKLTQNSCLLAVMQKHDMLCFPCNYVEFGAGRGQLTTSIIKAIPEEEISSCGFVLVDRGANRRKLDAKHRQVCDAEIVRLRTDIKDLCLKEVDILKNSRPMIGVSKHLCGVATDLTLRCIVNTTSNNAFEAGIIALCCHHRCVWADYVGKAYFSSLSLSPRDFSIISLISSWAVCCFREKTNDSTVTTDKGPLDFVTNSEKEELGNICKRLIDAGRIHYLKQNGFNAELQQYTEKSVTLENVALVFLRGKS